MKIFCLTICCIISAGVLLASDPAPSANELAARLSALRQDGTSSVRLKLDTASGTLQIQTKERRTKNSTEVLYQVLFPKDRKGEAVLVRRHGSKISGAVFTPPDKMQTLSASQLHDGVFGSALTYGDLVEDFFAWDSQTIVGSEALGRTECHVLESKAKGQTQTSAYTTVRSWIDIKHLVPLRIEKYNASGKLVSRIETTNVEKDDLDRHLPASMTIQRSGVTTTIQGSRIRHGVQLSDRDFTPEGMADLTAPRS